MATALSTAKPPDPLNLRDRDHWGDNWKQFERDWKYFEKATKISKETSDIRVAALLNVIGHDGQDMFETFDWGAEPENKDKIEEVLKQFRSRCVPEKNETFERYSFFKRNQEAGESMNTYITAVMKLANTCNFGALKDSHIRDRLVHGIRDDGVRQKLLGKKTLTLEKCLDILRSSQVTSQRAQEISTEESPTHAIRQRQYTRRKTAAQVDKADKHTSQDGNQKQPVKTVKDGQTFTRQSKQQGTPPSKLCTYCGLNHPPRKADCPAADRICSSCKKKGHYARVCRSRKVHHVKYEGQRPQSPPIKEQDNHDEELEIEYMEIQQINDKSAERALATFCVNRQEDISFQIDTGASCNILPFNDYTRVTGDQDGRKLESTRVVLVMHNKAQVQPKGAAWLQMERKGHKYDAYFIVVAGDVTPLLSLRLSQLLGLVRIVDSDTVNEVQATTQEQGIGCNLQDPILKQYRDVFEGLGCLQGEYTIQLDPNANSVVHPPRKVPAPMRDAIKEELEKMTQERIIYSACDRANRMGLVNGSS